MKKWSLLVLLFVAIPLVNASTPDFILTDLLRDTVENGESDFGDLLFIENGYISEEHHQSTITQEIYQQHDILIWGGNSVKVTEPSTGTQTALINGSEYYFSKYGTYVLTSMTNSSQSALLSINPSDDNEIEITNVVVPTGIELTFERTNFILDDEETINVVLEVDDDVESGEKSISFDVNGDTFNKDFDVLEVIDWTIDTTNLTVNSTVKAGEGEYIGRVIIENTGNQDVEITTTKTGNEIGMLGIPQPQTLYRKNILQLDFQIQVPSVMKAGVYEMKISFSDGEEITKEVDLNVTVVDAISPRIEEIEFSSDYVFVDNEIRVIATDNDDVVNLTIEYDGEKLGFLKDGNLFTRKIEFKKLSRYVMKFCAMDNEGNQDCEVINKTFSCKHVIDDAKRVLNMDSMRYGKYSKIYLFNITEPLEEPAIISLHSLDIFPKTNQSVIYRIVDDEGSIRTFGKYDSEILLDDVGEYFFEVRADAEVEVSGILRLDLADQYEEIEDITFKVEFKDYDVPKDFEVEWVSGRDVVCTVEDTGNLDTSYYDCSLKYPIDTRAEDISVPTTVSERNKFEGEADKVREELEKSKSKFGWVVGILSAVMLVIILYSVYMIFWYPYVRFQTGKATSEKNLGDIK